MANKTMTFGADLIPNSTTKQYSLGSSTNKWNIYGDWKGSVIPISLGGTNATTAAAAKVNLGINVTGQDIAFWNPNGTTQHWGVGATVLASETSGVTKPSEGHRTSLVVRDDGINVWDSTTSSTTWNINVNTGTNYGIFYRNGVSATVANNLYLIDNGYVLDNKNTNGGTDIGYRTTGSSKSIFLGVGADNTNRGISDTSLGGWAFMLDANNNVAINASSAITLGAGTSVSGYLQTTANMFAGWTTNTASVYNGARGQGGQIAFWIDNTSTTGNKGIWAKNASGTETAVLEVNQSGVVTLNGRANAIRDNANVNRWIYADYANTATASDWACMWVNPSGTSSVTIGAVSVVSMVNKAIIYSSTQPTVVNGKIWLKPV